MEEKGKEKRKYNPRKKINVRRPNNEVIIKALEDSNGILLYAADKIGCSRMALALWIKGDPELQKILYDSKEKCKDLVEHNIINNIKNGKEISAIFYAKTQMRDRGYVENPELQLPPMKINIVFQQESLPDGNNGPDITFERYKEPEKLSEGYNDSSEE